MADLAPCAVADGPACERLTYKRCHACGGACCTHCSRIRQWFTTPKARICMTCEQQGDTPKRRYLT